MQAVRLLERRPRTLVGKARSRWPRRLAWSAASARTTSSALYLTLAPFGGNLEGVRAASLAYFGKEPAHLSPAEAALLVALPRSPERLRPDRHPEAARLARDAVLERMRGCAGSSRNAPSPRPAPSRSRNTAGRCRSTRRIWRGRCATAEPQAAGAAHDDRPAAAASGRGAAAPRSRRARPAGDARRARRRQPDARGPRLCRQRRFCLGRAARHARHGARGALAGLGAEAVHLCDGVRPADHPSADRARRPAAPFRRLCARAISTGGSRARSAPREALQYSLNVPAVAVLDRLGPSRFTGALAAAGITAASADAARRSRGSRWRWAAPGYRSTTSRRFMSRCRMAARSPRCAARADDPPARGHGDLRPGRGLVRQRHSRQRAAAARDAAGRGAARAAISPSRPEPPTVSATPGRSATIPG